MKMPSRVVNNALKYDDASVTGLRALAHVAGDADLGPRFLALSGLDADGLRASAGEPATLLAVLDFLLARDADLVACADGLDMAPAVLIAARATLAGANPGGEWA